jgi:glycine cleavage system H lipoate-binding protein
MDAQFPSGLNGNNADWPAEMRKKYPGPKKPCGYYLLREKGAPRYCMRNYDCDDCPVEMGLGYRGAAQTSTSSVQAREVAEPRPRTPGGKRPAEMPGTGNQCVWMKAGIVNFHLCAHDFDCYHCPFDFSMRAAMTPSKPEEPPGPSPAVWGDGIGDEYRSVPGPCIHFLRGEEAAPAQCAHGFECFGCPVHQARHEKRPLQPTPLARPRYRKVRGYMLADGYYYHFGHSWVQILSGNCVRVGMDDFAARLFGPSNSLETAPAGATVKQGGVGWVLARGERRAPVQSPLTGKVIVVNEKALARPESVHEDPFEKGWLLQLEPALLKKEAEALFSGTDADQWLESENRALLKLMGPEYEKLAATGGEPLDDLFGKVPGIPWDSLVRTFLRMRQTR